MALQVGDKAPEFTLLDQDGISTSLSSFRGQRVVIYFYPKDDTPGCTLETNDFNKLLPKFNKLKCKVLGISKDNIKSHHKFKKKFKIKFDLLSDEKIDVIKKYKVWGKKKFMGREFMGIIRSTFLIDKKGKILKIWKNVKVKNHAIEVLNVLESLHK